MRNLNEPRRNDTEINTADIGGSTSSESEAEIIQFERRDAAMVETTQSFLPKSEVEELRARWNSIQTNFVDEPRKSVEEADKLIDSATKRISDAFSERRASLEDQWSRGDEVSTEDLRISLQQYRAFFSRLLSI